MADDPPAAGSTESGIDTSPLADVRLTDTQRAILTALCRHRADGNRYATPATNQEIADEVFLSVDAVKAHLRALYRKFGVEPLAHNQKRARLVELVLEGGLVEAEPSTFEGGGGDDGAAGARGPAPPAERPRPKVASGAGTRFPTRRSLVVGLAVAAAAIALVVLLTGVFSGSSTGGSPEQASTPAEFRSAVDGFCRLALEGAGSSSGASTAERARTYLGVIETMGGRLESLTPPPGDNRDLALFSNGLSRAADNNSVVAQDPPSPGSRQSAGVIAQLTLAAGQIQAGAVGYGLGRACSAIGSLVARSARNAAVPR